MGQKRRKQSVVMDVLLCLETLAMSVVLQSEWWGICFGAR